MFNYGSPYLLQTPSITIFKVRNYTHFDIRALSNPADLIAQKFPCPILNYRYCKEEKVAHFDIPHEAPNPQTLKNYHDIIHHIQKETDERCRILTETLKSKDSFIETTRIEINLHVSQDHPNSFEMFDEQNQNIFKIGGGQQPLYGLQMFADKNKIEIHCKGFVSADIYGSEKVHRIEIYVRPEHVHLLNIAVRTPLLSWLTCEAITFNFEETDVQQGIPSAKLVDELGVRQYRY